MIDSDSRVLARYVPQLRGLKWWTRVTDGKNGGLDSQERFKQTVAMLEHAAHNWRNPRLYHLCLKGATAAQYSALLAEFCRMVRRDGGKVAYKASIEHDSDKQLHMHAFVITDSGNRMPSRYITAKDEDGIAKPSMLRRALRLAQVDNQSIEVMVCTPVSQFAVFIQFNQTNNSLLNEACEWASYAFKARSKVGSGECYSGSRTPRAVSPA